MTQMYEQEAHKPPKSAHTYQQLKELSPIAYDEVAGAAGSSGVPWESRSVGKRYEGRLVPISHEEFPDVP